MRNNLIMITISSNLANQITITFGNIVVPM